MNKESGQVDWLDLPYHLMSLILLKLVYIKDYICFGAVCQSWHFIYKQNLDDYILHLPRQLPILLVTTEPQPHLHNFQTRSFFNLSENRVCQFPLPVPHFDHWCSFNSSQGWLIYQATRELTLFNPFLLDDNVIRLPELRDDGNPADSMIAVRKAVLSASPTLNPNYTLMASCVGINWNWAAAFYKPGNRGWTPLLSNCSIVDIIYHGNQFYAMEEDGSIWACDLNFSLPVVSKAAPCIFRRDEHRHYLDTRLNCFVESSGEFLGIMRNNNPKDPFHTLNFQVFKLDQNTMKWNETKSLCGRSVFVGGNTSLSILASDFPRCKPNCIYFIYQGFDGEFMTKDRPRGMGVYNMDDGTIEPCYPMESFKHYYLTPIWVEPAFSK